MSTPPPAILKPVVLKEDVRNFWNSGPCGSRYLEGTDEFDAHARMRYELEPYIHEFAQFRMAKGLRVLEIGVGMGADFLEWLKAGAQASGVDLSEASIDRARRRCELAGYQADLQAADAEHLPFADSSFDVVYSYGVMHHSPDTPQCVREAYRVLKPGGRAKLMVYHHPSLTGAMLWLRHGLWRGKSLRRTVFDYLESPGTKSYTRCEAAVLMSAFQNVTIRLVFSPGDLLLHKPSARYQSKFYRLLWKFYPRWLVRKLGKRAALFLLLEGTKAPLASSGKGPNQRPLSE